MEILPLTDPRWNTLKGTYSDGSAVAAMLGEALRGQLPPEGEGRLWQELCHQHEATGAGYAAIPHLVVAAERMEPERALLLLAIAGHVLSCSSRNGSHEVPPFLLPVLDEAATKALKCLVRLVEGGVIRSSSDKKALICSIAAFMKEPELYFGIEGLDCLITCPRCGHGFIPD